MPRPFKVTAGQEAVIDAVVRGGGQGVGRGGKTSTLGLVEDQLAGRRGNCLAFNWEIAEHARQHFPPHVSAPRSIQ